jgi:hypothetical protein
LENPADILGAGPPPRFSAGMIPNGFESGDFAAVLASPNISSNRTVEILDITNRLSISVMRIAERGSWDGSAERKKSQQKITRSFCFTGKQRVFEQKEAKLAKVQNLVVGSPRPGLIWRDGFGQPMRQMFARKNTSSFASFVYFCLKVLRGLLFGLRDLLNRRKQS